MTLSVFFALQIRRYSLGNLHRAILFVHTRKKMVSVQVLGTLPTKLDSVETSTSALNQSPKGDSPVLPHAGLRILVNIRMNNGVNVKECIRCGCLLPLAIGVD